MISTPAPDVLRAAGLKVTGPRVAVLEVLEEHPHSDAETVHRLARELAPAVTRQSIYNVLAQLSERGLVRRIEPADSPSRYERRIGDNHHHVVCTGCGAIDDVACVVGHAPCLTPSETSGYSIASAEVTFWGLCPRCQAQASPIPSGGHP